VAKNITAQPINDSEAEAVLQKRCPHFFENDGSYKYISATPVRAIGSDLKMPSGILRFGEHVPGTFDILQNHR